ncbi:MAG: hypothetical protein M1821_005723 [Bathelium mastoideum]|nr:MAG: hypothetical protein M1821_005723 [Bathelium mastoideum]
MPAPNTATNRTFFSNFLAAFRAHSALQKAASSPSATPSSQMSYSQATTGPNPALATNPSHSATSTSRPRPITTSTTATAKSGSHQAPPTSVSTAVPTTHFQPKRHHSTSPLSRSPGPPSTPAAASAGAAAASSTPTTSFPIGSPPLPTSGSGGVRTSRRRGSDSSSESGGFRDALGGEKWYIGGRTAAGEERFFQVGLVRRPRSVDRLSADRLSL